MKKIRLLSLLCATITLFSVSALAQTGTVSTVAGCNMCILTPVDGVTATLAEFFESAGIALDASRNVYIADRGVHKVRRILASSNLVYTVAGDGTAGFAGDGMVASATGVQLNKPNGIFIDGSNNLFIADEGNGRVRKVDAVTGIINTIAGGGVSTADGVPATTASLTPRSVYVDGAGNIYTSGGNKLKKIDGTTGIITSIAGNGIATDAGDGGPATAASIAGPIEHITMDAAGNIYIVSNACNSVRKIDAVTSIITTVVGGTTCAGDRIYSCGVSLTGNLIIVDRANRIIREIDALTKNSHIIAGGGSLVSEGTPALSTYINGYRMYMDNTGGNIYFTDSSHWVRKMSYLPSSYLGISATSFSTTINKLCSGPQITVNTNSYTVGTNIKTWFGDGQTTTTLVSAGCTGGSGIAVINHVYANSGTYTIKQVLFNGTIPVDSMRQTYQHTLCNDFYFNYYLDAAGNCTIDTNLSQPILTEIDSNGIAIDTISSTRGFYYKGYGNSGDTYSFKMIPEILYPTCPMTGIIFDTLRPLAYNPKISKLGVNCGVSPGTDVGLYTVKLYTRGQHQSIDIYAFNNSCNPVNATITTYYSPKYVFIGSSSPLPVSSVGNSIVWNLNGLYNKNSPRKINYRIENNPATGHVLMGDTVHSHFTIAPTVGDVNIVNNTCDRNDTSTSSWDPNDISVSPGNGCVYSGNKLTYTVRFENMGNDTAFNIHVLDTLSDNLDLQSMRIIMASNSMDVIPIHTDGYNIIKFDFPNIYLPDSSHHGLSNGAFIFSINLKDGLPDGTQIPNRVGIYFDYNPVVLTNTVVNTIGCPTGVPEVTGKTNVALFPNPATNTLTIKMNEGAYSSCTISNTLGQVVMQEQLNGSHTNISVAALPAGMYYVTLYGEHENKVLKFVKQ